jgi:DNA-binding PadR family transcriptional regulator
MKNSQSAEVLADQLKRRFSKSFLDVLILQLIDAGPTWGYNIIKETETEYGVRLRHGALYPTLNDLERKGLVKSRRELQKGRARKIYEITSSGSQLLEAYYAFIKRHLSSATDREEHWEKT